MSTFQFITVIGRRVMRCSDHNTLVCFPGQYTIGNHRGTDKSFGSIYFDAIIAEHAGNGLYKQFSPEAAIVSDNNRWLLGFGI
ncbi:hypothetical protein D3C72_1758000 [compost metagenome]